MGSAAFNNGKAENYVPEFFRDLAMNENDQRSTLPAFVQKNGYVSFGDWPKVPRNTMVFDVAGRVVDIRLWLPEIRAAARERLDTDKKRNPREYYSEFMGSKPRHRKLYRIGQGAKQKRALPAQLDIEEILQVASTVPVQMTRRIMEGDEDWRLRSSSKSWKDNTKCRKSWQKNLDQNSQPSVRTLNKQLWKEQLSQVDDEEILEPVEDYEDWNDCQEDPDSLSMLESEMMDWGDLDMAS